MGLYACEMLSADRKGFPVDLKQMAKKGSKTRGDSKIRQYENVTVNAWQDRSLFWLLQPTGSATVLRKQKDHARIELSSPTSLLL